MIKGFFNHKGAFISSDMESSDLKYAILILLL